MVQEHGFEQAYLEKLFSHVQKQEKPLAIVTRKRSKKPSAALKKRYPYYGAWDRYVKYKVTPKRIKQGRKFLKKYRTTFKKVEAKYGVPAEYIAAIIGIESVYGGNVGKHPVFDTLTWFLPVVSNALIRSWGVSETGVPVLEGSISVAADIFVPLKLTFHDVLEK